MRTNYPFPDSLRVTDSLELETMLQAGHTVSARRRTNRDNQFVVPALFEHESRDLFGHYSRDIHALAFAAWDYSLHLE